MKKGDRKLFLKFSKITIFFGIFGFCVLASGIYVANSAEKEVGNNLVLGIDVNTGEAATEITIRSQNKPTYTSSAPADSPGLLLEISDANVSELAESIPVNDGFVKEVKIAQFGEYSGFQGQIEIIFEKALPSDIKEIGNNLLVSVAHQAEEGAPEVGDIAALPPLEGIGEVPSDDTLPPPPLEGDLEAGAVIDAPPIPEEGAEIVPLVSEEEVVAPLEDVPPLEGEAEAPPVPEEIPVTEAPLVPPLEGEDITPLEADLAEIPPVGEEVAPLEGEEITPLEAEVAEAVAVPEEAPLEEIPVAEAPLEQAPVEEPPAVPDETLVGEAPPFPEEIPMAEAPPVSEEFPVAEAPPSSEVEPLPLAPEAAPMVPMEEGPPAPLEPMAMAAIPPAEAPVAELVPSEEVQQVAWIEGDRIQLSRPIKFLLNEAVILPESLPVVDEILRIMQENINLKVRVEGHTDSEGPARYNQALSEYRAIWIKLYLSSKGISPDRIQVFGYGESRPVAGNDTHAGREKNRRVEFLIVGR